MLKYQTVPEVVDVFQFQPPERPDCPTWPIELDACGCDAQDGHTCSQHRRPPKYSYRVRGRLRWFDIRVGEWYVRFKNGDVTVVSDAAFAEKFAPVPAAPVDDGAARPQPAQEPRP